MKILSVGQFSQDGNSNTCLHRNWSLKKTGSVTEIDSTFRWNLSCRILNRLFVRFKIPVGYLRVKFNREIIKKCTEEKYDIIWIDKGNYVLPSTLKKIKKLLPSALIIGYSPDNMAERHNRTIWFERGLKYYDWYLTTKSYIVDWLKASGCRNVMFVNNAFEETFHHPYELSKEERQKFGGTVGFIGSWEQERCDDILYLVNHGIEVKVWGSGKWLEYKNYNKNLIITGEGLFSEDYNKALSAFEISLCFLRKMNYDLQTTRTMEIPACKSLLLAERTAEHEALFKDMEEAVFFSSKEELLDKCKYLIEHPEERHRIAENGYRKCHEAGYSNTMTLRKALNQIYAAE